MKTIKVNSVGSIPSNFTGVAEYLDRTKYWYKEGKFHREDGPAIEYPNGTKYWYKEGKIHRENGPAAEFSDGTKEWYKEGKLHREDGPAIEYSDGRKEWWIEDYLYSPEKLSYLTNSSVYLGKEKGRYNLEWLKFLKEKRIEEFPIIPEMKEYKKMKEIFEKLERNKNQMETIKVNTANSIPSKFTGIAEYPNGYKEWYKEGEYHRLDGPAIELPDGTKLWYKEGELHRLDGPAVEYPSGEKHWYKEGKQHREGGPAVEYPDGYKAWYKEGKFYKITYPDIEFPIGRKEWYSEKEFKAEIERIKQINKNTNSKNEFEASLTTSARTATLTARGEPKMEKTTKEKVFEMAKSDAVEVAKRVAVNQLTKTIQSLLVELILSGKKGKQKTAAKSSLQEFFASDTGIALIKFVSGLVLPQIAALAEKMGLLKPQHILVLQVLSEEMRIQGEVEAVSKMFETISPMISMLTSGLTSQIESVFSFEKTLEPVRVALDSEQPNSGNQTNINEEIVNSSSTILKTAME